MQCKKLVEKTLHRRRMKCLVKWHVWLSVKKLQHPLHGPNLIMLYVYKLLCKKMQNYLCVTCYKNCITLNFAPIVHHATNMPLKQKPNWYARGRGHSLLGCVKLWLFQHKECHHNLPATAAVQPKAPASRVPWQHSSHVKQRDNSPVLA